MAMRSLTNGPFSLTVLQKRFLLVSWSVITLQWVSYHLWRTVKGILHQNLVGNIRIESTHSSTICNRSFIGCAVGRSENFKNANFNYGYSGFSALLYLETEKT